MLLFLFQGQDIRSTMVSKFSDFQIGPFPGIKKETARLFLDPYKDLNGTGKF
jgi:hypothetical protein